MKSIAGNLVLHRASELQLRCHSNNEVSITVNGNTIVFGPHTLAILDAFSRPAAFADALEKLRERSSGAQDWMDLTTTIVGLYQNGVLLDEAADQGAKFGETGFSSIGVHVRMLNDKERTDSYLAAIRKIVRPGD